MVDRQLSEAVPHERLSIAVAQADLTYVASALINHGWDVGGARLSPYAQYAALVAFETQKHFRDVWKIDLDASWDVSTATAARISAKFFDDSHRSISDTRDYFAQMLETNHGAFFPPGRRGRIFDFLRDDLAVASANDIPLVTNIGGHFAVGLSPKVSGEWSESRRQVHDLTRGIGNITAQIVPGGVAALAGHQLAVASPTKWWDGKSAVCLPQIFAGEFEAPMSIALMTVITTANVVYEAARPICCEDCRFAALKHRFVVLYQSARSLQIVSDQDLTRTPLTQAFSKQLLQETSLITRILEPPFRKLRNGLVHLGFGDLAAPLASDLSVDRLIRGYTGITGEELEKLVDESLGMLTTLATQYLLTPAPAGKSLFDLMHSPQ